jgi:hypothetical protein
MPSLGVESAPYSMDVDTLTPPPLDPLGYIPIPPTIAALPKAAIHLHQQWSPRLDRVLARRAGRPAYDWRRPHRAARDPRLLDLLAYSGVTVECSLSCNVVLGTVPTYEYHPLRQVVAHGIPVALCADVPVRIATTIGREYALAHALGFSPADLVGFTVNAIRASFAPPARKAALLAALDGREEGDADARK